MVSLLTLRDVHEHSKLSTSTLRAWVKVGRLPAIRRGRSIRIQEGDWLEFVAAEPARDRCREPGCGRGFPSRPLRGRHSS
jgi:excisionase family DNA binding protein